MRPFAVPSDTISPPDIQQQSQEQARLHALRATGILDTLPEQHYDDIAELASFICGTPISLVSFVDHDRQWFKAAHGLSMEQTPLSQSFCAHTLGTGNTLVVPNATADPRFQTNPLVTGDPSIRFYAGAPILDQTGCVLGTVCVIDTVPRTLSPQQIGALESLARQVTALLDQRRLFRQAQQESANLSLTRAELHQTSQQFALAAEAAGVASWFYDSARGIVVGDALMTQLFALPIGEASAPDWLQAIHPEDRDRVTRQFAAALTGGTYDTEYRLVSPKEPTRWVRAKARLLHDQSSPRLVGICEDITDRKRTEEALVQTAETLRRTAERLQIAQSAGRVAIFEWTLATGAITWANSEFVYGCPSADVAHIDQIFQKIHPDDIALVQQSIQPTVGGASEFNLDFRVLWPDGATHWLQGFGKPVLDADGTAQSVIGFNLDISERKHAEKTVLRNEKLAAVGRLASSIAHEINNPLEAVTNLLYLARHSETLQQASPFLETADLELRRAAAITNQTLRFHRQSTRPTAVTFAQLTEGIFTGQHSRLSNAGIAIGKRDRASTPVLCFEGEIRQVLTNLIGNAIDSMHGRGGTLYLRGRTTAGTPGVPGTAGLILTIADTGTGIPPAARGKLFDAFFTTKGIGGTGLGLWISKEILDRHHGRLRLRTSQHPAHHGTVFTVFLPTNTAAHPATPLPATL